MAFDSVKEALFPPTPIPVHDDGHMAGKLGAIQDD
jgi:hypothetical protein